MADLRSSHQALGQARNGLAEATRLLTLIPTRSDRAVAESEIHQALTLASQHCDEHLRRHAIEERVQLAAIRANAQIAARSLSRFRTTGRPLDTDALQRAVDAVMHGVDRMMVRVEAIESLLESSSSSDAGD